MTDPHRRAGQTSLETSIAILCSLALLFGIMRVFLWITQSFVIRDQNYEMGTAGQATNQGSRMAASGVAGGPDDKKNLRLWKEPSKLDIFNEGK